MKAPSRISAALLSIILIVATAVAAMPAHAKTQVSAKKWQAHYIFSHKDSGIEKELGRMTLEEKVGQMIIAQTESRFNSVGTSSHRQLQRLVSEGKVGGIMFMKGEAFSAAMMANGFQAIAPRPLLMSADMERGLAMRLAGATEFPPNMALAATTDPQLAFSMAKAIASEARSAGIHQSYSPNVDLNSNPANPVINTRSFGDNVELAISMSNAMIEGLQKNGIVATAKHFPGHGNVTVDSHLALPVLGASRHRLFDYELKPFKAAIDHGIISIMTGHLAVPGLTGTMEPASISRAIVTGLLRNELGFKGLIITDALNMKALYNGSNVGDISVKAVKAGNDLLLFSPDPEQTHSVIVDAVRKNDIPKEQIDASVRRILLVKKWLDLKKNTLVDLNQIQHNISPESHRNLAAEIASRSMTIVKEDPRHLPIRNNGNGGGLLNIILQDKNNPETGRNYAERLSRAFPGTTMRIHPQTDANELAATAAAAANADATIISSYVQVFSGSGTLKLTDKQQRFIHTLSRSLPSEKPLIFISFGTPYLIGAFPYIRTAVCTYSSNIASEDAVLLLLNGKLRAGGKLPVSLYGTTQ
ncbi:MAG: glycoside hydrolase family 3 protein [Chlorobium sp.]|uniref:glycoside hydrolase family 3 protein n=1 Tax=Chlorobium sp. TaxID=1095 RepID=UPI0025C4057F|nr:glycoside hydrolase family 3 protein [Chlorobium sp.]MCF8215764.1 glycoside hydrolase family 3 protein [Chlorobium sp.]MCF8270640.1 glycoside hydrolase family 3 protein [Chlorobium sp.]MCF8286974.1 glycoside hydrolase family 3 protein [Chlorobium sp.]MCF8290631.1 glycoside hydrolase family 3 protein [Chlorobium sp.]MCF8384774.1 glycoside hydrolase family 3 protein [Chlorobium sp.]